MLAGLSRQRPTVLHMFSEHSHAPSSDLQHGRRSHFKHSSIHTGHYGDLHCVCGCLTFLGLMTATLSSRLYSFSAEGRLFFPFSPLKLICKYSTIPCLTAAQRKCNTGMIFVSNKRLYFLFLCFLTELCSGSYACFVTNNALMPFLPFPLSFAFLSSIPSRWSCLVDSLSPRHIKGKLVTLLAFPSSSWFFTVCHWLKAASRLLIGGCNGQKHWCA